MNPAQTQKTYSTLLAERQGQPFSEEEATEILRQVLSQLVQQYGSVHGSISPDTLVQDLTTQQTILSPPGAVIPDTYIAPECQRTGGATPASDVYALGVTMLVLLTGKSPNQLQNPDGTWNWEDDFLVNDRLLEILNRAIAPLPEHRYANPRQMQQALDPNASISPLPAPVASPPPNSSMSDREVPAPTPPGRSLSRSSQSLAIWQLGIIGIAIGLIFGLIGFGVSRWQKAGNSTASADRVSSPSPTPSVPTAELSPQPVNPFKNATYPKSSCGDRLPTNSNAYPLKFYPVFLNRSDRNLRIVKTQFCQDAYPMFREEANRESIQVASFSTRERARLFQKFLAEEILDANVEVGEPTIVNEMPESLRRGMN